MNNQHDSIEHAVRTLAKALKDDPEFYYGYQSNIAISFQQQWEKMLREKVFASAVILPKHELIHDMSNQAAKNFLDLFINDSNSQ